VDVSSIGAIPDAVIGDLAALKLRLFEMKADEMPAEQTQAMAAEISAIRLHLKRLEADREWVKEVAKRATQ
jgi:hypothetical protein